MEQSRLPTIDQLYGNLEQAAELNTFNVLLNHPPRREWLRDHPTAKKKGLNAQGESVAVPVQYIPIAILEYLMTAIFLNYRTEVREMKIMANSISVSVRVHYKNPITKQDEWQDGVGACPLQVDAGCGAMDFNKIKFSAVQAGLPSAKSFAFKDAVEGIGKIFGKDMNRADEMAYDFLKKRFEQEQIEEEADKKQSTSQKAKERASKAAQATQEALKKKS